VQFTIHCDLRELPPWASEWMRDVVNNSDRDRQVDVDVAGRAALTGQLLAWQITGTDVVLTVGDE
jgi:hypothetical protein